MSASTLERLDDVVILHPDSEEAETVLYPCGTVMLTAYQPCQHSTIQVLCCSCAGCMHDVWTCGRQQPRPTWTRCEADYIANAFGTNASLFVFSVLLIWLIVAHVPQVSMWVAWFLLRLCMNGLFDAVTSTAMTLSLSP